MEQTSPLLMSLSPTAKLEVKVNDPGVEKASTPGTWSRDVLFSQKAFEVFAAANPWAARLGAITFALLVAACLVADIWALPKHLTNEALLHQGVGVSAIVDHIEERPYFTPRSNTKKFEVSVRYHLLAQDGQRYDGVSKIDTAEPPALATEARIPVVYNAQKPFQSAWRMALEQRSDDLFVLLVVTAIVSGWFGLFVFRYLRWQSRSQGTSGA